MSADARRRFRVLAPHLVITGFVRQDFDLLALHYHLHLVNCLSAAGVLRSMWLAARSDCVVCWFGSLRFLPAVLAARVAGRRVVVITGGYDVASEPSIRYGNMARPVTRVLGRWLFRSADRVACISQSIAEEAKRNARVPADRIRIVPLGYSAPTSPPGAGERLVLTVARVDGSTIYRKGLIDVARASRLLPDVPMVIAGECEPAARRVLEEAGGPNLTFTGFLSNGDLERLFRRARVYLQPSLHEGFGSSVAEAMAHGCVPVVSRRCSLPELVGNAGRYVEPGDVRGIADAVRSALDGQPPAEEPAARVLREFPAARHRTLLLELMDEVLASPPPRPEGR